MTSFQGFLNVFKTDGLTSHDVVNKVRRITRMKRVGHCGTLDPMATGVLPIALGSACRLIQYLSTDKVYLAEILLGMRTTTDDITGEILEDNDFSFSKGSGGISVEAIQINAASIEDNLKIMTGVQNQIPPNFSAIHYQGKRLYELAREGNLPDEIKPRQVTIKNMELLDFSLTTGDTGCKTGIVRTRVACSGGTYIRAIARDLGDKLGVGGCLKSLVREQSGPFTLESAVTLADLAELMQQGQLATHLIDPLSCLELPSIDVDDETARKLAMGQRIALQSDGKECERTLPCGGDSRENRKGHCEEDIIVARQGNRLIAVCEVESDRRLHARVVLSNADKED